jgi:hypothetical protein
LGSSKEDLKYLEDFIIDGEITQKEMEILQ